MNESTLVPDGQHVRCRSRRGADRRCREDRARRRGRSTPAHRVLSSAVAPPGAPFPALLPSGALSSAVPPPGLLSSTVASPGAPSPALLSSGVLSPAVTPPVDRDQVFVRQ